MLKNLIISTTESVIVLSFYKLYFSAILFHSKKLIGIYTIKLLFVERNNSRQQREHGNYLWENKKLSELKKKLIEERQKKTKPAMIEQNKCHYAKVN